ncbi:hypothetical protein J6590_052186 [Homalodisca vitripennis]|nr:hypothetical protein J6590_052186 [Homalodisca vitripennis]
MAQELSIIPDRGWTDCAGPDGGVSGTRGGPALVSGGRQSEQFIPLSAVGLYSLRLSRNHRLIEPPAECSPGGHDLLQSVFSFCSFLYSLWLGYLFFDLTLGRSMTPLLGPSTATCEAEGGPLPAMKVDVDLTRPSCHRPSNYSVLLLQARVEPCVIYY